MAEKESELGSLHEKVFHNKRERVAAFSLISHRMSGFPKMSGTNVINQRFVSTTNFWQYFGIIRGTDMILFDGTSQVRLRALVHTYFYSIALVISDQLSFVDKTAICDIFERR